MIRAEDIAKALGGRRAGSGWVACCPAHEDHKPSLSLQDTNDGRVLVHCHALCPQKKVIAALWSLGLWHGRSSRYERVVRKQPRLVVDSGDPERTIMALKLWDAAQSAKGTPVEPYLRGRGLELPLPRTLRFHPGLKHPSGARWPAMVALVTRGYDNRPMAVHRAFLARNGPGKAPVNPLKMMLGPCSGGAVRLAEPEDVLMIGEGIETTLAAMQVAGIPAWSALSTSGMRNLNLPNTVREVIVLADGDDPGDSAARACAERWAREGRRVRIARPPRGFDFNDLLVCSAPCSMGDAA
jgi:putative DNA primase/helicase